MLMITPDAIISKGGVLNLCVTLDRISILKKIIYQNKELRVLLATQGSSAHALELNDERRVGMVIASCAEDKDAWVREVVDHAIGKSRTGDG